MEFRKTVGFLGGGNMAEALIRGLVEEVEPARIAVSGPREERMATLRSRFGVRATVDNYGRRRYRRFTTHIGLTYGTPPEAVEAFCEAVRELIRQHPYTRKDTYHVYLNRFGPSSIDVLVYMFHACPDWAVELRERERFLLDVMRVAQKLDVQFAFPTQTLHVQQEEPPSPPVVDGHAGRHGVETARGVTEDAGWKDKRPGRVSFGEPPWMRER
ncbi:MAG: NAD(P)-binding domain-containing protein [Myxococcota bacterium]